MGMRMNADPVRSRNSDVRQLRLPSTVGGEKEPLIRPIVMEQSLDFSAAAGHNVPFSARWRKQVLSAACTLYRNMARPPKARHKQQFRRLVDSSSAVCRPVAPGTPPHRSCGQFHNKEQITSGQPTLSPNLDRGEVHGCQYIPVGFKKNLPRRLALPIGRRLNALCFEDVGNCRSRDLVTEIPERALNSLVAPHEGLSLAMRSTSAATFGDTGERPALFRRWRSPSA
jgi:hypothetical protein